MTLKQLAPNVVRIDLAGRSVLFSYETPIAVWVHGKGCWVRKDAGKLSNATAKHVRLYVPDGATPIEWNLLVNYANGRVPA